jgi:hypothetical protein
MAFASTTIRRRSRCLSLECRLLRGVAGRIACEWRVVLQPNGFTAELGGDSCDRATVRAEVLPQRPHLRDSRVRVVARLGGGWLTLDWQTPGPVTPETASAIVRLLDALDQSCAKL